MKRAFSLLLASFVAANVLVSALPVGAETLPTVKLSPPGQLTVAAVNARQNKVLRYSTFQALQELTRAFRHRPPAFNGGLRGGVIAPDIAVITEFRPTNVEVLVGLMKRKFGKPFEIVGPSDVQAALIIDPETVELVGDVQIVSDVCLNDETSDKPRLFREYPMARFKEISTGSLFTVIGVHLSRDYSPSGKTDCLVQNVREIRAQLENEPGAAIAAGDFNFRPTELPYECDPYEQGSPTKWWSIMTQGEEEGSRVFDDSVRWYHRARSLSMLDEWTYEHPSKVMTCNGTEGVRRSRIDYIFTSDATVAEAHADHPGWTDPNNFKYSDHRFIWGRLVLSGPPRVQRPIATQDAGGVITLSWDPVEGAAGWIVYRALPGSDYSQIATVDAAVTSYVDNDTVNDETYRYAIAATSTDSGQGVESPPVWQVADARGPHVTGIAPGSGAIRVSPTTSIRASFDEWVETTSVDQNTVSLYRNGNRIPGRVVRKGGFVIKFNPTFSLKKGETFTIVVRSVEDVLGNAGPVFKSRFSTVEPPKRRRHHRR